MYVCMCAFARRGVCGGCIYIYIYFVCEYISGIGDCICVHMCLHIYVRLDVWIFIYIYIVYKIVQNNNGNNNGNNNNNNTNNDNNNNKVEILIIIINNL